MSWGNTGARLFIVPLMLVPLIVAVASASTMAPAQAEAAATGGKPVKTSVLMAVTGQIARSGEPAPVTGLLTSPSGPVGRHRISVAFTAPSGAITTKTARTNRSGWFHLWHRSPVSFAVRVTFASDGDYAGSTATARIPVAARPRLSPHRSVTAGRWVRIHGMVRHVPVGTKVRLAQGYLAPACGVGIPATKRTLAHARVGAGGRFSFRVRLAKPGRTAVFATVPRTAHTAAGFSQTTVVRVRAE